MNTINNRITEIKEQIDNLVERLEENASYALSFYEEYSDDFATNEYLSDMILDYADSLVSSYYSSLWSWVREEPVAEDYIKRAVAEGLVDTQNFDLYKAIQAAQYLFYSDEVYADYSTLEQLHKLHRELAELEREQFMKNVMKNELKEQIEFCQDDLGGDSQSFYWDNRSLFKSTIDFEGLYCFDRIIEDIKVLQRLNALHIELAELEREQVA